MATSEYEYRVLIDLATVGGQTHALDARTSRIVMSNLNHMADEFAQVRVAMSNTKISSFYADPYLTSQTPAAADVPYLVTSATFPMNVRVQGQAYKLRVRIGGATANAAATATFYAVLGQGSRAAVGLFEASDSVYVTSGTASTSAAWLTGVSQGTEAYTTMMEMDAAKTSLCLAQFPTNVELGGDPATVAVTWATLTIFASTTNAAYTPRLYGLYAAEVIGL